VSDADEGGRSAAGVDAGTYLAVAGLFVLSTAAAAYEIAPASVTPVVMADLGVGESAAGWLVSVMYGTAVLASVPVGFALDRTSVRDAVTLAALALLLAGGWGYAAASAGAYWPLVASRVLGGLAYVVVWNAGANLAGRAVPRSVQATAVGVFTASAPAGFALGQLGGPLVADAAGWPAVFPAFGALAVLGIAVFRVGLAQTPGGGDVDAVDTPTLAEFRAVLVDRRVWTVSAMGFLGFSLYLFLNSWLPSYFAAELDLTLAESGLLVAVFPAVGVVARTAGGAISDRAFGGRRRPVALASFLAAGPVVVALGFVAEVAVAVGLLVAAGAAIQTGIGLLFSYVREVVEERVAATAVSLLTAVGLFGAFAAPIAAGASIELTGSYRPAFLGAGAVAAAGALLALLAPEPGR